MALTLVDLDIDSRLVVRIRAERLRLLRRDRRVALDERRHHAARRLNAEGKGCNVEQQEIRRAIACPLAGREDVRLDRRAVRNRLIRIHAVVQLLAVKVVAKQLADTRDARRATHHHDLVDLVLAHLGIEQKLVERRYRLAENVVAEALELRARNRNRTVLVVCEAIHLNGGLCGRGEGALGLLARRPQTTHGARIVLHIHLCLLLELLDAVVDEDVVKIFTRSCYRMALYPYFL